MAMTMEDFRDFWEKNGKKAEVQDIIGTKELTSEEVTDYLETADGKRIVDRYINRAIISHDEKQKPEIEKRIADAVADAAEKAKKEGAMSTEDRLQSQISQLQEQIAAREADLKRRDLERTLRDKAGELQVPFDLVIDLTNPNLTEDAGVQRLQAYAERHAGEIDQEVNKRLATNGVKPRTGTGPEPTVDLGNLSIDQAIQLEEAGELDAKISP
jgi:hypothetical protein